MTEKDPAAVALGRKGGLATNAKLTPDERKASAKKANDARWKNPLRQSPEQESQQAQ